MLSASDTSFIDNLSTRVITDFRNDTFTKDFIDGNSQIFLNFEWINVSKLKLFIESTSLKMRPMRADSDIVKSEHISPTIIKNEPDLDKQDHNSGSGAYGMTVMTRLGARAAGSIKTTTFHGETGQEVIEILSDSDSEEGRPVLKVEQVSTSSISKAESNLGSRKKEKGAVKPKIDGSKEKSLSDVPFDTSMFTTKSGTIWTDSNVTSFALEGAFQVTKEVRVDRVEYLSDIPCTWPIPRIQTAFILDLRDDTKYLVRKITGNISTPVTPDFLLKNKDQDSWKGGTGTADSTAQVTFQQGFPSITCRRSRLVCKGTYACSGINPALLDVERYDLDPASRLKVFEAQKLTRVDERSSVEQRAATFLNVCRSRCPAIDHNGKACTGQPKMKEKSQLHFGRGQSYFIACNGWKKNFSKGHQTHTIPDNVDEDILSKLIRGHPLEDGSNTNLCSLIISSHIGLKQGYCPHPHIQGGRSDDRLPIINHPCSARRTIYIPVDSSLRVALIVHKDTPHNHPMPRIDKASFETKAAYQKCIEASGILGATVQKVDQASSTSVLLGGKTPGQYNDSLLNGRIKQDIIHGVKKRKAPAGNGVTGVYHLYLEERNKPAEERYIQSFINTPDGGTLIFTCVPALLKLIHEVTSFECDVTFKHVQVLNEWEMVIYYPPVERAITIARVYINKADTDYYTTLFDGLQELTTRLTGKPLQFKRLSPGGNLLCMNADMEAAQILGAGRSFMKTNDTAYSGIDVELPEDLLPFFVRVCLTHSKCGVLDFKFLVPAPDYRRILNFPYLKSQAELDDFTLFITSLGVKKIQDWWNHKIKSTWIIPCILASKSKISSEHWLTTPATTNVGESQHHWTNKLTGIGLSLLEGIQTARVVDEQVAEEVESSLRTGIIKNKQTNLFHQQNRANQRLISTAHKTRKETVMKESLSSVQCHVEDEKTARQQSLLRQREYEASLKALTENGSGKSRMNIALFEETSHLRRKIDNEKDLRRRSTITQSSLTADLSELTASASGNPGSSIANLKRISKLTPSEDIEASSSGRVSAAFVLRGVTDTLAPDFSLSYINDLEADPRTAQVNCHGGEDSDFEVEGYGCHYSNAEKFEEDDDPEAADDLNYPPNSLADPRARHVSHEYSANTDSNPEHHQLEDSDAIRVPAMYGSSDAGIVTHGIASYPQRQPRTFSFNDGALNSSESVASHSGYGLEVQNTSFMDLLMDDEVNFDFAFNKADGQVQWPAGGALYRSSAASSSGEDLSTYGAMGATYSSSEGGHGYSESIYSDWNDIDITSDVAMNDESADQLILPIPRIPTSSPDSESPLSQHQFADAVMPTGSSGPSLKRPRAPVAADLDVANILPLEHRRKRTKPARVRQSEFDNDY